MEIGITHPLREFLHWRPFPPNGEHELLWCWDAHRVQLDRRVMLVLCNAANRFCCVSAMRATDWKYFEETCIALIREAMLAVGFSQSAVERYLDHDGTCSFGRTHGRKSVGCMNRAIDYLMVLDCDRGAQFQKSMTLTVNDELCHCATREDYGYPAVWMAEDLREAGIEPYAVERRGGGDASMASEHTGDGSASVASEHHDGGSAYVDGCVKCGGEARVRVGSTSYCLSCYNAEVEDALGLPHFSGDNSTLIAFDEDGRAVEFAVERFVGPNVTSWTAREMVGPGNDANYVGIEVGMYSELDDDPQEALNQLWDKTQAVLSNPSTRSHPMPFGNRVDVLAEDNGWGKMEADVYGAPGIVVDGKRYSGDEFLRLFSSYEGFELHWTMKDRGIEPKDF